MPLSVPPVAFDALTLLLARLAGADWAGLVATWSAGETVAAPLNCPDDYSRLLETGASECTLEVRLRPTESSASFVDADAASDSSFKNVSQVTSVEETRSLSRSASFNADSAKSAEEAASPVGEAEGVDEGVRDWLGEMPVHAAAVVGNEFLTALSHNLEKAFITEPVIEPCAPSAAPAQPAVAAVVRPRFVRARTRPRHFPAAFHYVFNFFQSVAAHALNLAASVSAVTGFSLPFTSGGERRNFVAAVHVLRKHLRTVSIKVHKRVRRFVAQTANLSRYGSRLCAWLNELAIRVRRLFRRLVRRFHRLLKRVLRGPLPLRAEFNQRANRRSRLAHRLTH